MERRRQFILCMYTHHIFEFHLNNTQGHSGPFHGSLQPAVHPMYTHHVFEFHLNKNTQGHSGPLHGSLQPAVHPMYTHRVFEFHLNKNTQGCKIANGTSAAIVAGGSS